MQALKVPDGFDRDYLNKNLIIVCTYKTANGECDCVDMSYQDQFPDWEVVEALPPEDTI